MMRPGRFIILSQWVNNIANPSPVWGEGYFYETTEVTHDFGKSQEF